MVTDTRGDWSAAQAWEQSQGTQAIQLSHPYQTVHVAQAKTLWAAWRLPAAVVQDLPVWLGIHLPFCVDVELWVRWNNGDWHLQTQEQHQRNADWAEGHLLPVWVIQDTTFKEVDVLLKVENAGETQLSLVLQKPDSFMRYQAKWALVYFVSMLLLLAVMIYAISLLKYFDKLTLFLFISMLFLQAMALSWLTGLGQFLLPQLGISKIFQTVGEAVIWLWLLVSALHTRMAIAMNQLPKCLRQGVVYWAVGWALLGTLITVTLHSHEWLASVLLLHAVLMLGCCVWQHRLQPAFKTLCYTLAWGLYVLAMGLYLLKGHMHLHAFHAIGWASTSSVMASLVLVWGHCWRWLNQLVLWRDKLKQVEKRHRWLAMVQHDLWQPLQSMQLYANALVAAKPEQLPRLMHGMQLATKNAVDCMRHLQDWFEVLRSGKVFANDETTLNANDLLQPLITECMPMAHARCISLRYCSNRSLLCVNAVAVQRMLRNLIHNALDYTPAGGTVLIGCRRKKDRLWIYCVDNGPGMTSAQLQLCTHAHQRFQRQEGADTFHSGLGLYSVSKMAEQLGLAFLIQSKAGKGSTFALGVALTGPSNAHKTLLLSNAA